MVAQKFGSADPDLKSRVGRSKGTKERVDKAMLSASKKLPSTGLVGGVANDKGNPSMAKTGRTGTVRGT